MRLWKPRIGSGFESAIGAPNLPSAGIVNVARRQQEADHEDGEVVEILSGFDGGWRMIYTVDRVMNLLTGRGIAPSENATTEWLETGPSREMLV